MVKKIAVLTSGGDAPGMNAAIAATVKRALYKNVEVYGISRGYEGLLNEEIKKLTIDDVEDIIHRGGTILQSARSELFKTAEGLKQGIANLKKYDIEGVIVIGGDGSLTGAAKLAHAGIPTIGIPATIDNDINATDYTIGFDTAVNTVMESIDKVRETASSIGRVIVVEVMGRDAGDLALWSSVCTSAEAVIIPEESYDINDVVAHIKDRQKRKKMHSIIVVAEGACSGDEIKRQIEEKINIEVRVMVLGYLQRGGSPNAYDRIIASKMGARAVDLLMDSKSDLMIGLINGRLTETPFSKTIENKRIFNISDYQLATCLSI